MKQRIEFIDLVKGICISLVVLLHVYGDMSGTLIKIMSLFRMPLYFVLSGLFFKTYDGLIPFIKKKTNKLIIPFLFTFLCIIIPAEVVLHLVQGTEFTLSELVIGSGGKLNLGINGAVWFLLCLFFVNIIFYLIFLLTNNQLSGMLALSFLCGTLGYLLNYFNLTLPIWIDTSLTVVPFFFIGYVMRGHSDVLYGKMELKDYISCVLSLLLLVGVFFYDEWEGRSIIIFGDNKFDIGVLSLILGGVSGTYFVLMVSKYIQHVPLVSYLGRYSIVVLLTHLLYLFLFRNLLFQMGVNQDSNVLNLFLFFSIMFLELPTIKFCVKFLPYCFAQKDIWK